MLELGFQTKKDFIVIHHEGNNSMLCCPCGRLTLAPPEMLYKSGAPCAGGCGRRYCTGKDGQVLMLTIIEEQGEGSAKVVRAEGG